MRGSGLRWNVTLSLAGCLGLAGIAASLILGLPTAKPGASADPGEIRTIPVRVVAVHFDTATSELRFPAVIEPRVAVDVGFRVPGKIEARLVDVGDVVDANTVLARLDPTDLIHQETAASAGLTRATADSERLASDLRRSQELHSGGVATEREFDLQKASAEMAAAAVTQAQSAVQMARDNLSYAQLKADGPGVISRVLAEAGQVVAVGQPIVTVANLGEAEAVVEVPEQQADLVGRATLSVEVWSLPGRIIASRLRETSPIAGALARTYRTRITLIDPPPELRLGMTATLIVKRAGAAPVARLPSKAIAGSGEHPAVWVVRGGSELELRPVTVAAYGTDTADVLTGLKEGELVVTAGVQKLAASDRVRIWSEPAR